VLHIDWEGAIKLSSSESSLVRWLGGYKAATMNPVWVFEYVLKYIVPEERAPPIYYRWIHELYAEDNASYALRVSTGEGLLIDAKILGRMEDVDPGEILFNLSKLYILTYPERLRALNAYSIESFDMDYTIKDLYSEIYKTSIFPARVVLLETLREHGEFRELNQSVLHVNWVYVMSFL